MIRFENATNPNDEVLERSIAFAPAQRLALIPISIGIVAIAPWTGWITLLPYLFGVLSFVALTHPGVQRRYGIVTPYAAWILGTIGVCGVGLLADGPAYLIAPVIILPAVLGIAVFPVRDIPWIAVFTTLVVFVTCWFADSAAVREDPAPSTVSAILLGTVVLIAGMARKAETDSFLESRVDPLTGAHNRLALDEHLEALPTSAHPRPWALILADIDHFKALNDRYGHAAGDRALREVADYIRRILPTNGRLYRFGGEEFLVSLVDCQPAVARRLAERIRKGVAKLDVGGPRITMSFGVASTPETGRERFDALFARTDQAMYEAKDSGRDAVVVSPDTPACPEPFGWKDGGDTARARRIDEDPATKGGLIQSWFEREHLVDMMRRQFATSRFTDIVIVLPLLLFIDRLGYATSLLGLAALILFRAAQANIHRFARPELMFAPAWVGAQALITLAVVNGDEPWGLFALVYLVVTPSAAVPWRLMRWGFLLSAVLIVVAALSHGSDVLTSTPQAIVAPLILLVACAVIGRELGRRILAMRRASLHDGLTGIPNRAAFDRRLDASLGHAARHGGFVSLVMADIDHFKKVNDHLGHSRGDAVLIATTSRLQSRLRQNNAIHRVGGEEFAILLPGVHESVAVEIATRLRAAIAEGPVSGVALTMSFGVATGDGRTNPDELYRAADAALYRAKRGGRNRVERASEADQARVPVIPRRDAQMSR